MMMCPNEFAASPKSRQLGGSLPQEWGFPTARLAGHGLRDTCDPLALQVGEQGRGSLPGTPPATPPTLARRLQGGETDGPRYGQGRDTEQNSAPSNRVPRAGWLGERFAESGLLPGAWK